MRILIPARLVRLAFFILAAGVAGFISAEATAATLCILVIIAACCRSPIRLELILAGMAAFAARYSEGDLQKFKAGLVMLLPLVIALGGLYLMSRAAFGPRDHRCNSWRRHRSW